MGNELNKKAEELEVVRSELDVKIRENEMLHIKMFELKQSQNREKNDLSSRIKELETNLQEIKETSEKERSELQEMLLKRQGEFDRVSMDYDNVSTKFEALKVK